MRSYKHKYKKTKTKAKEISSDEFAKILLEEMPFMEVKWYAAQMGYKIVLKDDERQK